MRIGVLILPEDPWAVAAEKWRRAEALGFDHVWTYDHVVWDGLPDSPWYGAIPTLTAAALVTERIRLGTLVASPNFRHPAPFARELITLDDISGGRLTLGIGAGSRGSDGSLLETALDNQHRTERFSDFVGLLDRLLLGDRVTFSGHHWRVNDLELHPGCVQKPRLPFAIAATVPRTMAIAARHGSIWVTNGDRAHRGPPLDPVRGTEVVARQLSLLKSACESRGRDPTTIDRLLLTGSRIDSGLGSPTRFAEVRDAYAALGITDLVVHWPRQDHPYAGDETILEKILD